MREIKKTIKVPFQRIDFGSTYSSLENMDSLESLLVILIVTAKEEGLKRETLREAIELKFGVKQHTISIIKQSIKELIRSGTLEGQDNVSIDDLLDKSIGRVLGSVNKEVVKNVLNGKFLKKSEKKRKFSGRVYENIIEGFKYNENGTTFPFEGNWKVDLLSEEAVKEIAEGLAEKEKKENESLDYVNMDSKWDKVETQEKEMHFKIDDKNNIISINTNATSVFNEIKREKLSIDSLVKMMDAGVDSVEYLENNNGKIISIIGNPIIEMNEKSYVIEDGVVYKIFNKHVNYNIKEIDEEINVVELFGEEIKVKELVKTIISTGDVNNVEIWSVLNDSIQREMLSLKPSKDNIEFYKYSMKKEGSQSIISNYSNVIKEFYNEDERWELFKNLNKNDILSNLKNINTVLGDASSGVVYKALYTKLNTVYDNKTIIFPKWDAEIKHSKFIIEAKTLESKIELIEVKKEAEQLMEKLNGYDFSPIKSSVLNSLKEQVKSMVASKPESPEVEISTNAIKIRLMLESLVERKKKDTFREALTKAIKNKKIMENNKNKIYEIYVRSNEYHHKADIKFDIKKEREIKQDIINIEKISKNSKVKLDKFKGVFKWATA